MPKVRRYHTPGSGLNRRHARRDLRLALLFGLASSVLIILLILLLYLRRRV